MDYRSETRAAYRDERRAAAYENHQTRRLSWARFATWRELRGVKKALRCYVWSDRDIALDVPCGTGILGATLSQFPFRVVAADISMEMMGRASGEYREHTRLGFVQADITDLPLGRGRFACVIALGLLHRLPQEIRERALHELSRLAARVVVVSYSVDGIWQRGKRAGLRIVAPGYKPPPNPIRLEAIRQEITAAGFTVVRWFRTVPALSADVVFVLEKRNGM